MNSHLGSTTHEQTNEQVTDRIPAPSQGSYTAVSDISLEIEDGMLPTKPTLLNHLHPLTVYLIVLVEYPYTTFGRNGRLASRPVLMGGHR